MTERPIVLKDMEVRAILDNRKTQLRKVITVPWHKSKRCQPYEPYYGVSDGKLWFDDGQSIEVSCPWGQPGDRLWVKESYQPLFKDEVCPHGDDPDWEKIDPKTGDGYKISYVATDGIIEFFDCANDNPLCQRIKPSIHMPRWASRITLEVVDIKVQRLQEISEEDAVAEGVESDDGWEEPLGEGFTIGFGYLDYESTNEDFRFKTAKESFKSFWNFIKAKQGFGWDANPWIWAITFKRIKP